MGLSTQANISFLINWKANITGELQHCSLTEQSLTRDMSRVTKKYQQALNTKVYKWSNNGGVSYSDISYSTLMRPSAANGNKPYMLTNTSGKVVVDNKYKKYAEMISPNGAPGGDWESNREQIISELTGIPVSKIQNAKNLSVDLDNREETLKRLEEECKTAKERAFKTDDVKSFLRDTFGTGWGGINDSDHDKSASSIANEYTNGTWWALGSDASSSSTQLNGMIDTIYSRVSNYLPAEDAEKFKKACEATKKDYKDNQLGLSDGSMKKTVDNKIYVSAKGVIDTILGNYASDCKSSNLPAATQFSYVKNGTSSTEYQDYLKKQQAYEEALAEYKKSYASYNEEMTSSEEQQIKFYDDLFEAIVLQGWEYDANIEDPTYLNEMLQNNMILISTLGEYGTTDADGNYVTKPTVDTSVASNFYNFFLVNDSSVQNDALVEYEYEKGIIKVKEQRNDERRTNLETQLSAVEKMIDGDKGVRDENVDRVFDIFT